MKKKCDVFGRTRWALARLERDVRCGKGKGSVGGGQSTKDRINMRPRTGEAVSRAGQFPRATITKYHELVA